MAILSVKKTLPRERILLRHNDAAECLAAGLMPDAAVRQSAAASDYFDVVYADGRLAAVWGYRSESLFSWRCQAWLLTTDEVSWLPQTFTRTSIRVMKYLFSLFEEVEVVVHKDYEEAIAWLSWLGFERAGRYSDFLVMLAKRENARWVSR